MNYKELTAPCGIPCFECVSYKAKTNETIKKRISVGIEMDYDKSECEGCRSRNGKAFLSEKNNIFPEGKSILMNSNGKCKIYLCVESKKIHDCSECDNFPCEKLQPLSDRANKIPHNLKIYNLSLIKKMGLEKWATEKAANIMKEYNTTKFDCE
jgi:hypothetical protein